MFGGAGYAQISRRKSAVLRDIYHNSWPEDLNLSWYCRARGSRAGAPKVPHGAFRLVDKSPIIINVLPEQARGIASSLQRGQGPAVLTACLVRRKGRANFRRSLGSGGNQYSFGFELIQR